MEWRWCFALRRLRLKQRGCLWCFFPWEGMVLDTCRMCAFHKNLSVYFHVSCSDLSLSMSRRAVILVFLHVCLFT